MQGDDEMRGKKAVSDVDALVRTLVQQLGWKAKRLSTTVQSGAILMRCT